jgi:hypothetical protein
MSSAVVSVASFDASKVTYSPLKMLDSGGKSAYLNYDSRALVMQIGSLSVPYGMSVFDKAGPVKYSVELSLRGYDGADPKAAAIYKALAALDEHMINAGVENSKQWFKAALSKDVVKAFYTPTVRFSKDAEGNPKPYPPTVKLALRQRDGKFETAVYDDKKRPLTDIPLEDVLMKGSQLTALIQCTGVWFAGSKYGLSWKAVQIRVDKMPDAIRGFAFLDDGDAPKVQQQQQPQQQQPKNTFAALQEDDEIDDEEAFQAKPTPAPAPAPAEEEEDGEDMPPIALPKKVITKKAVVKTVVKKA